MAKQRSGDRPPARDTKEHTPPSAEKNKLPDDEQPLREPMETRRDEERLKQDDLAIRLPEMNDIPGQENIVPAPLGEMADVTASSDDEEGIREGKDILGDDDDLIVMGTEADVTDEDIAALGPMDQDMDDGEDENIRNVGGLDDTDLEGEPLNEGAADLYSTGDELDVPGEEARDEYDDEENDYYSLGGDAKED